MKSKKLNLEDLKSVNAGQLLSEYKSLSRFEPIVSSSVTCHEPSDEDTSD